MSTAVCLTVDVEDWYEGMSVLGESIDRPSGARSGLSSLGSVLESTEGSPRVTLFVVGSYAHGVAGELSDLARTGHEIASHGPDHGRLPERPEGLLDWLKRGREMLEDLVQQPVRGFRSPRFDVPAPIGLRRFRELLADAGFDYVSDTSRLGTESSVRELPVLTAGPIPIGGGSYQRLLPMSALTAALRTASGPSVLYYHSYDFGATLPAIRSIRSLAVAKQLVARDRVARVFSQVLRRYGSRACIDATR